MTRMKTLILLVASAFLVACSSGPKIQAEYDHSIDFTQYRTYSFFNPMSIEGPNYSTIYGQYFREAIRRELNARGYKEVQSDPDLMMNVSANLQQKTNVQTVPSAGPHYGYYGYRRGFYDPWYGYGYGTETYVSQYTEGTINVDMVDAREKRMVWEGVAIGTVKEGRSNEEVHQAINDGIARMFENYPFRAGQG